MINPTQIPDEVVEASARAMCKAAYLHIPALNWEEQLEDPYWREQARAAIAAALNAWPDRHLHEWQRPWLGGMSGTDIILPLPAEASDDK